jgi:hypothetical protein
MYPTITDFLLSIADLPEAKNRNILEFIEKFKAQHVLHLDELRGVSADVFEEKFDMVWGDAHFLHRVVNRKLRDIERVRKERRKRQRHE